MPDSGIPACPEQRFRGRSPGEKPHKLSVHIIIATRPTTCKKKRKKGAKTGGFLGTPVLLVFQEGGGRRETGMFHVKHEKTARQEMFHVKHPAGRKRLRLQ
jgi:hypothetical protein